MRRRTRLLWFLILAGGAAAAFFLVSRGDEAVRVTTERIERVATLELIVSATGEIRAKEFVDIQAEIPGVIVDLPVAEGQSVTKGQVLLRIDPFQARQDVESATAMHDAALADAGSAEVQIAYAEASLRQDEFLKAAAESELEQSRANAARLETQYRRRKELFEGQVVSSDELEAAETAWRVGEGQLKAAAARLDHAVARVNAARVSVTQLRKQHEAALRRADAARAALDRATDLLGKTTIASPLEGVITRLNVEKGERAVPGIQSNPQATLMTIADLSVLEAEIRVDETDIIKVALGHRATVTVDALPDVDIEGAVTEIGNAPIAAASEGQLGRSAAASEGRDFKVVIRLESPPQALRPGLTASAEIRADRRENCLVVPLQALTVRELPVDAGGTWTPPPLVEAVARSERRRSGQDQEDRERDRKATLREIDGVFVREGGRVRFRPVKIGIKGEMDAELLEGLAENEEIVVGPYKVLRTLGDGDSVIVDDSTPVVPRSKGKGRRGRNP